MLWARRDLNPRPPGYEPLKTETMRFSEIDKEDFWKYLIEERKVSIKWAKAVVRVLERYVDEIDLESLRKAFYDCTNKKDFVLAVRDLIHYLVDRRKMDRLTALDILEARFLKPIKSKRREIYLKDSEIVEGLKLIRNKWDTDTVMLYKFLCYTGLRLAHAVRALETFDKRNLEIYGKVAVYPMSHVVIGEEKKAFIALMPAKFAKNLRPLKHMLKTPSWNDRINPRRWKPPVDSRIDANAIRKWHMNFLVRHKIDSALVNFIQGRSPEDVGSARYLQKRERAIEAYAEVVDRFPI